MSKVTSFGLWLRRKRNAANLSQEQLTTILQYADRSSIARVEQGERLPSAGLAEHIADWLRIPPDERAEFIRDAQDGKAPRAHKPPTNLLTSTETVLGKFVGRTRDIEVIHKMLKEPAVRLITLVGPGGVGKTRLAIEAATEVLNNYPDGVFLINLAPLSDPTQVLTAIAQTLKVAEIAQQSLLESLGDYLHDKQFLLILDNLEHLLEATPTLSGILGASSELRLLITSRAALNLRGEYLYEVLPLEKPDLNDLAHLQQLVECEAIQLFIERARQKQPKFSLTNDTAPSIAEICYRLDGLPLAIELATAHIRYLTPQMILMRLSKPMELLVGGPPESPIRHQSLRDTIEWSVTLLNGMEYSLFRQLAIFRGGCTLGAAEQICLLDERADAKFLQCLSSLVDKSLLRLEVQVSGEPRYTMLQTILEYGLEELEMSNERFPLLNRYVEYFLQLAEEAERNQGSIEQASWISVMDQEIDNLRSVMEASRQQVCDLSYGLRVATAMHWYWESRGYLEEGRKWLADLLTISREGGAPHIQAKALVAAADLAMFKGNNAQARALLKESLVLWTSSEMSEQQQGVAMTLDTLGRVAWQQERYDEAKNYFEQGLVIHKELRNMHGVAFEYMWLGRVLSRQDKYDEALEWVNKSLVLSRKLDDNMPIIASALESLGRISWQKKVYEIAKSWYQEAILIRARLNHSLGLVWCLTGLADICYAQGYFEWTACLLGAAQSILENSGYRLDPVNERRNKRTAIGVRNELGIVKYAALRAQGYAMNRQQAVDLALHPDKYV